MTEDLQNRLLACKVLSDRKDNLVRDLRWKLIEQAGTIMVLRREIKQLQMQITHMENKE